MIFIYHIYNLIFNKDTKIYNGKKLNFFNKRVWKNWIVAYEKETKPLKKN